MFAAGKSAYFATFREAASFGLAVVEVLLMYDAAHSGNKFDIGKMRRRFKSSSFVDASKVPYLVYISLG